LCGFVRLSINASRGKKLTEGESGILDSQNSPPQVVKDDVLADCPVFGGTS
jgi:hypothetical protein